MCIVAIAIAINFFIYVAMSFLLMQIYEWCCHIRQLNEPENDHDKATTVTLVEKTKELPAEWKSHLIKYYAKKIEVYSFMIEEYQKAKLKSKNSRNLSEFPSIDQWTPPTRTLSSYEKSLCSGPSATAHIIKTAKVRMPDTNQLIVYSASRYDRSSRIASSYVCMTPGNKHPQFGRILYLYHHSFCDHTCIICEISLFQPAAYDNEVKMWYVPLQATDKTLLQFITTISPPLIISVDETESFIWFLNYCDKQQTMV